MVCIATHLSIRSAFFFDIFTFKISQNVLHTFVLSPLIFGLIEL